LDSFVAQNKSILGSKSSLDSSLDLNLYSQFRYYEKIKVISALVGFPTRAYVDR